jgi:antitoxin VapB
MTGTDMAFHVRDEATDAAVRKLAKLKNKTLTATIREAVEREHEREQDKLPFQERLKALHKWIDDHSGPNRRPVDKAFYDELSGEDELTGLR